MPDMFTFEPKRILCPLDYGELSDLALKYASVAAREYNGTIYVLHGETFELPRYFSQSGKDHLIQESATIHSVQISKGFWDHKNIIFSSSRTHKNNHNRRFSS